MKKLTTKDLSQNRLKELLHYNPNTGVFIRKVRSSNHKAKVGDIAGSINKRGYIQININNKKHYAHRLAFLYMEGYFPENEVDHINRDTADNKWENLRHVSRSCNLRNSSKSKNNKSGVVGVCWLNREKLWQSQIMVNRNNIKLGCYKNFISAVKSRWGAEKEYNFPNCNSSSTAYLFLRKEGIV